MRNNNTQTPSGSAELQDARFRLLLRSAPVMNLLEAACVLALLWMYHDSVAHWLLGGWAALVLTLIIVRVALQYLFHQLRADHGGLAPSWSRWSAMALLPATGLLFGLGLVALNPVDMLFQPELVHTQAIATALVVGLTVVAMASYGVYLPVAVLYLLGALAPGLILIWMSELGDSPLHYAQLLVFMLFMLVAARRLHASSASSLELQLRNQSLIDYLDRARADAEALNEKLATEIRDRREARQHLQQAKARLESMVRERTRELEATNRELSATSQRLQLALDASNIYLWDWNLNTGESYNARFSELLGYDLDQFGSRVQDLERFIHPEDFSHVRKAMVAHFKGETEQYQVEYRMRHATGEWRWIEDQGRVVEWDRNGRAVRMIGTRRDVTDYRQAQEQLRLSATVFENASEGIFILDRNFRFLAVNDYFTRITGYTEEEIRGRSVEEAGNSGENRETYAEITRSLLNEGFWEGELTERRKSGETYPEWLQVSAVYNDDGRLTHYVGMFSDLTARREAEERVQYLSNYDRLTGFANRSQFRERLHKALTLARLNREEVALLFIDMDRFRPINDTLGHEVGDRLLNLAAERLRGLELDEENIARVGGDEFTVILEDHSQEQVEAICNQIINTMKKPFHFDQHELLLGASIGVSTFPETARNVQNMVNQADLAMHQAKRAGGNNYQFYSSDMRVASVEQLALETSLRKAIFKNEFVVYYQPKMDLGDDRISAVEALVRWEHPTMGLLSPRDFIPLAEETGLISAIGELVLERACRQAKQWHDQGLGDIGVSVNLSAHQFRKGNLLEIVDRVLDTTELPPRLLELELTESLIMEDLDANVALLQELRTRGIALSLDDFGTGYSSLNYLKRFPVDTLKIDRSFVMEIDQSPDDSAITRAIIEMAHSLNMRVVAEGVETEQHLEILRLMGCDSIQGYLLSRPVPEPDLIQLVQRHRAGERGFGNPH